MSLWPTPPPGKWGGLLNGLRILDLSRHLPGPLATLLLADLGAAVIKIEPPNGDEMRSLGPIGPSGRSIYFDAVNAGKAGLRLDLRDEADKARFLELLDEADILLESFRPGTMARLGLGPDMLRARNTRLIWCSLSGFGATGPRRDQAGHDNNYLALNGVLAGTGLADRPVFFDPPIADVTGSMMAAIAILGAVNKRSRDGQGCVLDLALADSVMPLAAFALAGLAAGRGAPQREGELLNGGAARYRVYRCRDGKFVTLGAVEPKFWAAFCAAAGRPDWTGRYDDPLPQSALIAELADFFACITQAEAVRRFEPADCCLAPVLGLDEAVDSPQLRARGLVRRGADGAWQAVFPALVDGEAPATRPGWREMDSSG
jgi:crotonobetainyl-CoA:carnitine CoA-transferase CaiB-like acyl-CoA transferase